MIGTAYITWASGLPGINVGPHRISIVRIQVPLPPYPPQLTELQLQTLDLLGVPECAYLP